MTPARYRDCEAHGGTVPLWSLQNYEDELESSASLRFEIFTEAKDLEAFIFYRLTGDEMWIVHLAVREKGRGEGHRLLEAFVEHAGQAAAKTIGLEVSAGNAPARALYAKHGFTEIGVRRAYYRDGSDALVLRRIL